MALRTKLMIMNAALTKLGWERTIENSGRPEVMAVEENYDEIVRAAFEAGEFPFGKEWVELTGRVNGKYGYTDGFTLPHDVLHILAVHVGGSLAQDCGLKWEVEPRTLYISAGSKTVQVEYIRAGSEDTWSSSFATAVQLYVEAVLKDFAEETGEAESLRREAEERLNMALTKASQNRSRAEVSRRGRLANARRGR